MITTQNMDKHGIRAGTLDGVRNGTITYNDASVISGRRRLR